VSKGLTSFRALAFFGIFLVHINVYGSGNLGINAGYLGVMAFFVLSGFLLTPILVDMKSSLNRKDFFFHFYGRRALRIFPLYYSYLVIVASVSFLLVYLYGKNQLASSGILGLIPIDRSRLVDELYIFIEQLPWTMTYTYDFYYVTYFSKLSFFATHFWSLAVEEQFYLAWPLAIFFIPNNHLKKFLLLVIMAGPFVRLLLAMILNANVFPVQPQTDLVIYILPFSHIDAFAIGGYFALYGKNRSGYFVWLSILLVILLGVVTSWFATGQIQWDQLGYMRFMQDSYKYIWGYSIVNLIFAYMLVHIRSKTFMPALFEHPLSVYLGRISYGLYVFHLPVLWLTYSTMDHFPEIVRALTTLLITIIISTISYEFMERRFINLKDRYFSRSSAN
jgi:peptidoglycan/LPS O-acetylase OafA/YrhL